MSRLLFAELLKIRKRWLPYALLLVLFIGAGVQIWLAGYASYVGDEVQYRDSALRAFAFPYSFVALLDAGQFWGSVIIGVLVSSMVATEYTWGTVRQALIRGETRAQYITAKLISISAIATAGMLLALAVGLVFSFIAMAIADIPVTLDVPDGPAAAELPLMVLRAAYAILPYGLLAFCLVVVGRSTALGVAGIVLYVLMEAAAIGILGELGGPAPAIRASLIGHNASALLAANRIGAGDYNAMAFRNNPLPADLPDPAVGALVLALYCSIFLFVAYRVFMRHDLGTDGGGG